MATRPDETLETLQAELTVALERIDELEEAASHSGAADLQRRTEIAEEKFRQAEERSISLTHEVDRLKENVETLQDTVSSLERSKREDARGREDAQDTITRLKATVDRLNDELQRERSKASEAAVAGARAAKDKHYQNTELDKALVENAEMRDEMRALQSDLDAYRDAVAELKGQLLDSEEHTEEVEQTLAAANGRIAELTREVQEARSTAEAGQAAVDAKTTEIRALHDQAEEAAKRGAADLKAANERATAAERTISTMQQEIKALKEATRVKDLEDELAVLRSQMSVLIAQREEASLLLDAHNQRLEQNDNELLELQDKRAELIETAVKAERRRVTELSDEIAELRLDVEDERQRCLELTEQKTDVESALASARERLSAYERSYGLEDAVKEQEQLREAIRRRDADIARLTNTAALQMDSYDMLEEIARRLAERAGLGRNLDIWTLYPDTDLKQAIQSTVERLRSANLELMRQNDALESQRTKLLRQLRVHAEQMGENSLKYYGLSAEQLVLVNEFAENLRDGKVDLPVNDSTLELQEVVRKLQGQIADLQEQLFAARTNAGAAGTTTNTSLTLVKGDGSDKELAALRSQAAAQESAARSAELSARQLQQQQEALQATLKKIVDENASLRKDLAGIAENQNARFDQIRKERDLEVSALKDAEVTRLASMRAAAAAFMSPSPLTPETDEALREVYAILRHKLDTGAPLDPSEMAALYRAFARMIQSSEELSRQLSKEHDKSTEATANVDALTVQLMQLRGAYEKQSAEMNDVIRAQAKRSLEETVTNASSSAVPRTMGGRALMQRLLSISSSRLPPEEWTGEVTDAHAALVEALEELSAREDEIQRLEKLVTQYNDHLTVIAAQHTALYHSFLTEKAAFESNLAQARDREAEAIAKTEGLAAKAARLDELTAVLSSSAASDALANQCKKLTRQVAALEVVQPMLVRKYNLVKFEVAQARGIARTAELSALEAESHLRQRILYLELWKKGAESRLHRLTELAQTWVPGDDHAKLLCSFQNLQQVHADLLASEAQLRAAYVTIRDAPLQISTQSSKIAQLQAQLDTQTALLQAAQEDYANAKAALAVVASEAGVGAAGGGATTSGYDPAGLGAGAAAVLAGASKADLLVALTKQRHDFAETEISAAALTKRVELLNARVSDVESQLLAMTSRAHIAEDALGEARAAASKAEAAVTELETRYANSLSSEEVVRLRQRLNSLEDEKDALLREVTKARELADIASDQASSATGLMKDREEEVAALLDQVRALSSRSDDEAIIGKLQATVLNLKGNFHAFLRKHDTMRMALQRTRVAMMALEVVVDQRGGELLAVQEDARVKQLAMNTLLDEMRTQLRSMSRDGFTLVQAQHFNDTIRRLTAAVDAQARELALAHQFRRTSEEQNEAIALENVTLQKLIEDLKAAVVSSDLRASTRDGTARFGTYTGVGGESRDFVRRLSELHESLKSERLTTLRQRREISTLREEHKMLQKRMAQSEGAAGGLEEKVVSLDTELRRREDEYRRQIELARNATFQASQQHSDSALFPPDTITAASDAQSTKEHVTILQEANRKVRALARAAVLKSRDRKRRITFLEGQLRNMGPSGTAAIAASTNNDDYDDSAFWTDAARGLLGLPPAASEDFDAPDGDDDAGGSDGGGGQGGSITHGRVREHYEGEIRRLQQAAQQTISSMKQLLDKKNQTIMDYQNKMEALRQEFDAERHVAASEKGRISVAAYEEQKQTIENLRTALRELQAAPAGLASAAVNQQLLERTESLERALDARDREAAHLETAVNSLKEALDAAQLRAAQAGARVQELEAELGKQRGSLVDASRSSSTKDVTTASTIADLRTQLAARDRKLKNLQASLAALKEEFVRAEEEHAAAFAQLQAQSVGRGAAKGNKTPAGEGAEPGAGAASDVALQTKVQTLLDTVNRMKQEVTLLKARESAAETARDSLTRELDRARAELASQRDVTASVDATERRLRAEIARLQSELDRGRLGESQRIADAIAKGAADASGVTPTSGIPIPSVDVTALTRRIRVLEAQNAALRSATSEAARLNSVSAALPPTAPPSATMDARPAIGLAGTPGGTTSLPSIGKGRTASRSVTPTALQATADDLAAPPGMAVQQRPSTGSLPSAAGTGLDAAAEERLRNALENERKLRKRVETLSGKLNEKQKELDASKTSETGAVAALARIKADRDALEKRVLTMQKRQATIDAATAAAMEEIEPLTTLKAKMFELEENNRQLSLQCHGELPATISRLEADLIAERKQVALYEQQVQELTDRLSAVERGAGVPESNIAEQNAFRLKLSDSRRRIAALESEVMTRDATVLELQNEVDVSREALDKLRRRIAEMNAYSVISSRAKTDASHTSTDENKRAAPPKVPSAGLPSAAAAAAGSKSKREAELEDAVTALRRVNDKQKIELERLRYRAEGSSAPAPQPSTFEHAPSHHSTTISGVPAAELADTVRQLREARGDVSRLRTRVSELESEVARLESSAGQTEALRSELQASKARITELEALLREAKATASASQALIASTTTIAVQQPSAVLQAEVQQLKQENARLLEELSAFDVSFFEEIEDLKWKYAEAAKKCRAFDEYVRQHPPA